MADLIFFAGVYLLLVLSYVRKDTWGKLCRRKDFVY
jgi:hypothetical protein